MKSLWNDVEAKEWNSWQWQLRNRLTGYKGLQLLALKLNRSVDDLVNVIDKYRFSVTPYYSSLVNMDDPTDPILRQFIPDLQESDNTSFGQADPFNDLSNMHVPGVVHRFSDRVLVLAYEQCATYCRHCTRKNIIGSIEFKPDKSYFKHAIKYIRNCTNVREVIISGGDPLLLPQNLLDWLLAEISSITHVKVMRIHTRVPVVLPMRINESLCRMLKKHRPLWINTQFNHPNELTDDSIVACDRIIRSGIPVSSQAVLLRGVNDSVDIIKDLCNSLQEKMIRPYYIFQCDPVCGVGHFAVGNDIAMQIYETLRENVGGMSMPRFVVDQPGAKFKVPLESKLGI